MFLSWMSDLFKEDRSGSDAGKIVTDRRVIPSRGELAALKDWDALNPLDQLSRLLEAVTSFLNSLHGLAVDEVKNIQTQEQVAQKRWGESPSALRSRHSYAQCGKESERIARERQSIARDVQRSVLPKVPHVLRIAMFNQTTKDLAGRYEATESDLQHCIRNLPFSDCLERHLLDLARLLRDALGPENEKPLVRRWPRESIHAFLVRCRKQQRLSVAEVCQSAGVDKSAYYRLRKGEALTSDNLFAIAEALRCPAGDLKP